MSYNSSFRCVRLLLSACSSASASAVFVSKFSVSHRLLIGKCAGCVLVLIGCVRVLIGCVLVLIGCVLVLIGCVRVLIEIYDSNMNTSFHHK